MPWQAHAPSNIALIKYMGKLNTSTNVATNPSLSYTLPHLQSHVRLELSQNQHDEWQPLSLPDVEPLQLSANSQQRFLDHLQFIKNIHGVKQHFTVFSANNFPQAAGLASSASSFAALTRAAIEACCELTESPLPSSAQQAQWSRHGSGSSCRSFFAPWTLWEGDTVQAIELPYTDLIHHVVLLDDTEKKIPSSLAHQRVQTSPDFSTRAQRAEQHLHALRQALSQKQWRDAYRICFDEFQDMHALFHNACPPFSYMNDAARQLLTRMQMHWDDCGDGPLITMDAGPNIHLLFRGDQHDFAQHYMQALREHHHVI